jgi:stalled ribosome alternative rescue factor ArfA
MAIKSVKKKNIVAKKLLSKRYNQKVVPPKKGKGSFNRKKN